jgi:hypothetical protein
MMRATGAKLRMLASDAEPLEVLWAADCGGEVEECGEEDDMMAAAGRPFSRHTKLLSGSRWGGVVIRHGDDSSARLEGM